MDKKIILSQGLTQESFQQKGDKNTSIGTAETVNINNVTTSSDEESLTSAIDEMRTLRKKIRLYEELGIVNCTEELKGTQLEPMECMKEVHSSLYFMGVGGEKWVKEEYLRKEFENMLRQTKIMGGEVKFLLIDPSSKAYGQLYKLRGESVPYLSYERYADLDARYDNLKVRLYNTMPSFRMQFVDETYLAISRYYFDKPSHESVGGGWRTPHLIINSEQREYGMNESRYKGSLYGSFLLAYNFIWGHSTKIHDWVIRGKRFNR